MTAEAELQGLRELVEASRDGFLNGQPYILTYSDIIERLRELEVLQIARTTCDYVSEFGDSTKCGRKKGHKGLHMMVPIVPVTEKGIVDNDDRAFFDRHYWQIAKRLHDKRLWRGPWRIEVNECVYKFTVTGYAKKGSEVWKEKEAEASTTQAK